MSFRILICAAIASALTGCATPQSGTVDPTRQAFTLKSWKLQGAIGCLGENETPVDGGGSVHEFFMCGGSYSDAHCTPWRIVPNDYLIARCTYTLKTEHRTERLARYLRCEGLTDDMTGCGDDYDYWEDIGSKRPVP